MFGGYLRLHNAADAGMSPNQLGGHEMRIRPATESSQRTNRIVCPLRRHRAVA